MSPLRILLLTNRDSDNVGDQIIEATVISIIKGVMKNLDYGPDDFVIASRAAGIISKRYMKTEDPKLLAGARETISKSDLIVFGGAPLFNYTYQNFYLRTIKTLELANEYGVPVLFSSIGVEKFDPANEKCLALKEALALPVVKQITTRDDLESLQRYAEGTQTPVSHVADPAVLADIVYREKPDVVATPKVPTTIPGRAKYEFKRILRALVPREKQTGRLAQPQSTPAVSTTQATEQAASVSRPKRIGLVVTRAGIFADNGIKFSESNQRSFWLDTMTRLEERGFEYKLFTTGHFSDEVFLDALMKSKGLPASIAKVTVNSPDELLQELRACDGIIAYRLHASITSFAFGIPSIGLSWNFKVPYFYESIGYGNRALGPERWSADDAVPAIEAAMAEGVEKDTDFLKSVYDTLFNGIKGVLAPESVRVPYSYTELWENLPRQAAIGPKGYQERVSRKLRRTYENYHRLSNKAKKK